MFLPTNGQQIELLLLRMQSFLKQKRSAFVFITTEIDESHLALEDLRKLDAVDEVYLC